MRFAVFAALSLAVVVVLTAVGSRAFEGAEHQEVGNAAFSLFTAPDRVAAAKTAEDGADKHTVGVNGKYFDSSDISRELVEEAAGLDNKLKAPSGLEMGFGDAVAMFGDFIGEADRPLADYYQPDPESDAIKRAEDLWQSLMADPKSEAKTQIPKVLPLIAEERDVIDRLLAQGKKPLEAYASHGDVWTRDMAIVTASKDGVGNMILAPILGQDAEGPSTSHKDMIALLASNKLLDLASYNIDHFDSVTSGLTASRGLLVTAYMEIAKWVWTPKSDAEKRKTLLTNALLKTAWAAHFSSDMYAAGHLRTPRAHLFAWCLNRDVNHDNWLKRQYHRARRALVGKDTYRKAGGLLSKCMHDEDNLLGLEVHSAENGHAGDYYPICGDGELFDPDCAPGMAAAKRGVFFMLSSLIKVAEEVAKIRDGGKVTEEEYFQGAPDRKGDGSTNEAMEEKLGPQWRRKTSFNQLAVNVFRSVAPTVRTANNKTPTPNQPPMFRLKSEGTGAIVEVRDKIDISGMTREEWGTATYSKLEDCVSTALKCYEYVKELKKRVAKADGVIEGGGGTKGKKPAVEEAPKEGDEQCYFQYKVQKSTGPYFVKAAGNCKKTNLISLCGGDGECAPAKKNPCEGTCHCSTGFATRCLCMERVPDEDIVSRCTNIKRKMGSIQIFGKKK